MYVVPLHTVMLAHRRNFCEVTDGPAVMTKMQGLYVARLDGQGSLASDFAFP